ncbi:hypothetical protein MKW98_016146 [Papaver atlanticum]|uniref:Cytochrome P450 n=1 Tax=Papaver atlanticum TaxID=357466 RepID=A0AAD4S2Q1_9MAGN|nr:hypothetical protein MKW98_016146 [Papaver atlanticum]
MSDKYGSIFMVRFGMYPTLVVSSWELSKECFTTNDRCLANRPPSAAGKYLTSALFCFSSYGPYWREIRKICTLQLLSRRRLELLKHVPYSEIDNCIKRLHGRWMKTPNQMKQSCAAAASIKVDMSQLFGELTMNGVLRMVIGKTLLLKDDNDENYPNDYHNKDIAEGQKLHKTITEFTKLAGVSVASDVLPFLGRLDIDGNKKHMKRIAKEMNLVADKWLEEHKQERRSQTLSSTAPQSNHDDNDFMDVLLSVLREERDELFGSYSQRTVIKATCLVRCPGQRL